MTEINYDLLNTPLTIAPKVFINRMDENYFLIGNIDQKNSIPLVKNLFASIYNFCDYAVPKNILSLWPEDEAENLKKIIINLKEQNILITKEEYQEQIRLLAPDTLKEENDFFEDTNWLEPFLKAIDEIPEYSYVLNLGAKGAGALALEIAQRRNPEKVVGTTENYNNYLKAKQKAIFAEKDSLIDFICAKPYNISKICYFYKFNVLLLELFSANIFDERILEAVLYAKLYLLTPNVQIIPSQMDVKIFAYDNNFFRDILQESKEFDILYGFDFAPLRDVLKNYIMGIYSRLDPETIKQKSDIKLVKAFDFNQLENYYFETEIELEITQPGRVTGFCVFFELPLTKNGTIVSNSPFAAEIKTMQRVFIPATTLNYELGDTTKLKISYDGTLFNVQFAV